MNHPNVGKLRFIKGARDRARAMHKFPTLRDDVDVHNAIETWATKYGITFDQAVMVIYEATFTTPPRWP